MRRSLVWAYGAQGINLLVGFGSSVALARLLAPSDFGIFMVAAALSALLGTFTDFGVGAYLVREKEIDPHRFRSAFTINAALALCLSAILNVAALVERLVFDAQIVGQVLHIISLNPLVACLMFGPTSMATREMRFGQISAANVVRTVVTAIASVLLALAGLGALSFAWGSVAGTAAALALWIVLRPRVILMPPSRRHAREICVFGVQMMSIGGVAQAASRVSDLVLGYLAGLAALGIYGRAANLSNIIFNNVYGSATNVLFSRMSQNLRDHGTLHEVFSYAMRILLGLLWPMLLGLAILSGPIILTLYGERWLGAALPLSLLMIAQFVVLAFGMNWELFVLRKRTDLQARFELIRATGGTAAFSVGAVFGINWAAAGRIVEACLGYLLYRPYIDEMAGMRAGEMGRLYHQSLWLTLVAVSPSAILMAWYGWSPRTPLPLVAGAVLVGMGGWATYAFASRHPLFLEAERLWRVVRGREAGVTGLHAMERDV